MKRALFIFLHLAVINGVKSPDRKKNTVQRTKRVYAVDVFFCPISFE